MAVTHGLKPAFGVVLFLSLMWGCAETAGKTSLVLTPIPEPKLKTGPLRVGLQSGHWNMPALPEELRMLRDNFGAEAAGVREADVNHAVAESLAGMLRAEGFQVDVLPGTVPPGYQADAFLALHADWGYDPARRGWKLSTPWRASPYARLLADRVGGALRSAGLPEDAGGVTLYMRGYYAFNYRRYFHSVDRFTPGIILEMGMLTNALDRRLLSERPGEMARILAQGLKDYFRYYDRSRLAQYDVPDYPTYQVAQSGTLLRQQPSDQGVVLVALGYGDRFFPAEFQGEWVNGFVWGKRIMGWVPKGALKVAEKRFYGGF